MANNSNLQQSYHIGAGFWAHVTWESNGKYGIAHNGVKWFNRANPVSEYDERPETEPKPEAKGWVSAKDMFIAEREREANELDQAA